MRARFARWAALLAQPAALFAVGCSQPSDGKYKVYPVTGKVTVDGKEYLIMTEDDILAVVE